ncbi:MAG: SLC13/DASS family transporter [Bacteroidetes bacterium]|nr:MAG: SLC13/DASS family transporter [Bacteroidota bacterium]
MKKIGLILAPLIFGLLLLVGPPAELEADAWRVIGLAVWMLLWWITEAVPLAVTALLPLVWLPLLQIMPMAEAARPYADPLIFLFMGGFMIALAMERWALHRRIALNIVARTGTNANRIILGFMLATAFLSMWISNTATAVMMLPIALSVLSLLTPADGTVAGTGVRAFGQSLMLGIAYAANIGGTATIIGTPPNVVFSGFIRKTYEVEISFASWLLFGLPFAALLLYLTYLMLTRVLFPNGLGHFAHAQEMIEVEIAKLGAMSKDERRTLYIFAGTALAWILRKQLNQLLGLSKAAGDIEIGDHLIAMIATILLFMIPANWKEDQSLLKWRDTEKLPWGILLLFGGGISLAGALKQVGLIDLIGAQFEGLEVLGFWVLLGLTAVSLFLTEVMSNVALVTVFLPVVGAVAVGLGLDPVLLCIPVTLAASCAFMLPMSTPPNAIVFASGKLRVMDMVRAGFWLNLLAIAWIALLVQIVLPLVLPGTD